MDALAVAVRLHKTCWYDNLTIAIVVVIRTLHAVGQTTLVEGLTGNITGFDGFRTIHDILDAD